MFALHCLWMRLSPMPKTTSVRHLAILFPLLAASLSACTLFEPRDDESWSPARVEHTAYGETEQHEEVLMLLNRFKILDSLSSEQLQAAHTAAERTFSEEPTPVARLQLAWLLTMKNTGFQDVRRAAKLLDISQESDSQETQPVVLNDLVHVIRSMVVDQKLQRDKHKQMVKALGKERSTNSKLAAKIEKLEKKIEDLTQIEESMIQRKPLPETELR